MKIRTSEHTFFDSFSTQTLIKTANNSQLRLLRAIFNLSADSESFNGYILSQKGYSCLLSSVRALCRMLSKDILLVTAVFPSTSIWPYLSNSEVIFELYKVISQISMPEACLVVSNTPTCAEKINKPK